MSQILVYFQLCLEIITAGIYYKIFSFMVCLQKITQSMIFCSLVLDAICAGDAQML